MEAAAWVALAALGFTIVGTVIGAGIRLTWWLGHKFAEVDNAQDARWVAHEQRDQARHEDNLVRFTRIEAQLGIIIRSNGHH